MMQVVIETTLKVWNELVSTSSLNMSNVNEFIDEYEFVLCQYGSFLKGLRADPNSNEYHKTIEGVLGIVSMNMEMMKLKLKMLKKTDEQLRNSIK